MRLAQRLPAERAIVSRMTHLAVHQGGRLARPETFTQAVSRRLRGKLGEYQVSGLQLAAMTGLGRTLIFRRLSGETALNTDELERICAATGIDMAYLVTGIAAGPDDPSVIDEWCAIRDLNPEPAGKTFRLLRPWSTAWNHSLQPAA